MKKLLFTGLLAIVVFISGFKTEGDVYTTCIGFYNLENLFDTLDTPNVRDTEFTPEGEKKWNTAKYQEKLKNMAQVIAQLGTEMNPKGVAAIGVCEVENKSVLKDLVKEEAILNRNYQIIHYDSPDRRGIDVALLYQADLFKVTNSKSYTLKMPHIQDYATRDQLLVSGELEAGEKLHIIVCHWPSRRGGEKKSRPLRIAAAELAKSIIDSLHQEDPNAQVMLMGDLNDDPINASLKKGLKATGDKAMVKPQGMFNSMYDMYKRGNGTLAYRDNWNLFDQIVVSEGLLQEKGYYFYASKVFNKPFLKNPEGSFKGYPYRTYVGPNYQGGYSDHFPVYAVLVKKAND